MTHFCLTFFKRPHLSQDGVEKNLRSSKFLALLAYLSGEEVGSCLRSDLASLFWPETSEQAGLQNLRQAIYQWGKVFSNLSHSEKSAGHDISVPFLRISRSAIQFCPNHSVFIDTLEFVKAIQMGNLERAVELYQGEFLGGFVVKDSLALEEWLLQSRAKYHQMIMRVLYALSEQQLANGEYPVAQRSIERQLMLEPWNEQAHRQKMRMLTETGQKEAALVQFELCRQTLRKRFEVSPTKETLDLYKKIRTGQFPGQASRLESIRNNQAEMKIF
jgi:DNA-binding SARP family transcriptional activator